ncbi:MAG: hypothetical protein AAF513_08595 [Pseudomonadota bacterium]
MKALVIAAFCFASLGCANAHQHPQHTHTPKAPNAVKVRCAATAEHPRVCVQRWRDKHSYTHRHANHDHHGHGKQAKIAVVVPIK